MTRKTIARANGRDGPVIDVIERAGVCNPDRAISAGQDALPRTSFPKPSDLRESDDMRIAKAVDSIRVAAQTIPSLSSKRARHVIAGQAFRPSIVLHNISMDTKEPLALGADPKIAVMVEHQGARYRQLAAVEPGRHEWFDRHHPSIVQVLQPGPSADMPTQRDPSGPRAKPLPKHLRSLFSLRWDISETPACQWTRALCALPAKSRLSRRPEPTRPWEIGIPSDFPKHLTAGR